MKRLDYSAIGRMPQPIQILLLDYMRTLDRQKHSMIYGLLIPAICGLIAITCLFITDKYLSAASFALCLSLSSLALAEGKPWAIRGAISTVKNYRQLFIELYALDIRRLTSIEIWTGLTLEVDSSKLQQEWYFNKPVRLIIGVFISVMIFAMVLFSGIFLTNSSFWVLS